jgi:hypothetical protein
MNSKRITIPVSVMQSFREGDFNPPYREKFDHAATLKEPKITVNEDEAARILECLGQDDKGFRTFEASLSRFLQDTAPEPEPRPIVYTRPLRSHNTSSGPHGKRIAPKLSAVQRSQNHAIAADLNTRQKVAGARGSSNRSILVSDERGQYHATKGWRMLSRVEARV